MLTRLLCLPPVADIECCRYSKSEEAVELMGRFKSLLDPNQILNPYKLLPAKNQLYKPQDSSHATAVV